MAMKEQDKQKAAEILAKHIPYFEGRNSSVVMKSDVIAAMLEYASKEDEWISANRDADYDGQYLGYIEKLEECKAINYYQRVVTNQMNKWVLNEGETLIAWKPLPTTTI